MQSRAAREVMERNALIPKRISRKILKTLSTLSPTTAEIEEFIDHEQLRVLQEEYRKKAELIDDDFRSSVGMAETPRNLPVYLMLEDIVPGFSWRVLSEKHERGSRRVAIDAPFVDGLRPSLSSLLVGAVSGKTNTTLHERYQCVYDLPTDVVKQLAVLFEIGNIQPPNEIRMTRVVEWIKWAMLGNPVTVITPICPDYAVDQLMDGLFRFTFDGLNQKIGVVGRRYLDRLPLIDEVLGSLGIRPRYIAAIGDFEGFVPENRARVNLSEPEFMDRLRRSQETLRDALPIPTETPLFTEIGGGKKEWMLHFKTISRDFMDHRFGESGLSMPEISTIGQSRKPLYDRWYGPRALEIGYDRIALDQGAEYATMGAMIRHNLEAPLVLGADHAKMAPFYSATGPVPVLYLRNNYVGVG